MLQWQLVVLSTLRTSPFAAAVSPRRSCRSLRLVRSRRHLIVVRRAYDFFSQDPSTYSDALITDVDAGTGDHLLHVLLWQAAEAALYELAAVA
jgi:hypothetical protein